MRHRFSFTIGWTALHAISKRKIREQNGICAISTKRLPITTTLCQTIEIQKGWEERGEMIIRTISKQCTGGATEKKDRSEWMTNGESLMRVGETSYFV